MNGYSNQVLIATRAALGLVTSWIALLLLGGQAPSGAALPAAMPALLGVEIALVAAAALFLAGLCLVFRILDRLLVGFLAIWALAVLASAWLMATPLYRLGNPLLLTPLGWELVVTMIAAVATGGLAWATRAGTTITISERFAMGDMRSAAPRHGSARTAADREPYAAYVPGAALAPDAGPNVHDGSPEAPPSPISAVPGVSPGVTRADHAAPATMHDTAPPHARTFATRAEPSPYDRTFAALVSAPDAGSTTSDEARSRHRPAAPSAFEDGARRNDPRGEVVPERAHGAAAQHQQVSGTSAPDTPPSKPEPGSSVATARRPPGYDNAWVTL